jgi:glycosyltransferase involved in cell wall biosynthesis
MEMKKALQQRILIISLGNIPIGENQIVEGGGLRSWGIAKSLSQKSFTVRLLVRDTFLSGEIQVNENLRLVPYFEADQLLGEIKRASVVIYPAGAPHLSSLCVANRGASTILIADAYVPIHVEVAARQFEAEIVDEEANFQSMSPYWLQAVVQADIILCASKEQQAYYLGILAGTGSLTPSSYGFVKIVIVPFGYFKIEKNNELEKGFTDINPDMPLRILWYGGFYPWFNSAKFGELLKNLDKSNDTTNGRTYEVRVVGAINPFLEDKNFLKHAKKEIEILERDQRITFSSWLPYDRRGEAFASSDIVICLTAEGYENELSWRTRYIDFIEFEIPLLTNSSDPFATKIIHAGAGWQVSDNNLDLMTVKLKDLINNPSAVVNAKKCYSGLQESCSWENAISPLAEVLESEPSNLLRSSAVASRLVNTAKINPLERPKFLSLVKYGIRQLRTKGIKQTLVRIRRYIKASYIPKNKDEQVKSRRALIFAHQLDFSGSPLIAYELALNMAANLQKLSLDRVILLVYGNIDKRLSRNLLNNGIEIRELEKHQVPFMSKNDLIIVNGLAQSEYLVNDVVQKAGGMRVEPIFLVHEDRPSIHQDQSILKKLGKALSNGSIRMISPSRGTTNNLQVSLKSQSFETRAYPLKDSEIFASNFEKVLNIHLTGSTHDTRKNQQFALILVSLVHARISDSTDRYRKIHLHLIGVDGETNTGRAILELAKNMHEFVTITPPVEKEEALILMAQSNAVLCISEYEALPLFVSESMAMGQIVIRNSCSGIDEQLIDQKNGILVDVSKMQASVDALVQLLDKEDTPDSDLKNMGLYSRKLVEPMIKSNWLDYLGLPAK